MLSGSKKAPLIKIITIVGLVGLCIVIYCTLAPDSHDNFRGIKWGSGIHGLSRMNLVAEEGELKFYSRQNDTMKMEDIDIDNIIYGFRNGKFYTAIVYYSSEANFKRIRDLLYSQHGSPYRPDDSNNKYFWNSEPVDLLLVYDAASNKGRISYYYTPIKENTERE